MLPTLLTADEVAETFRVRVSTVNRWAREGVISVVRVPGTKQQLFRAADVAALLDQPGKAS